MPKNCGSKRSISSTKPPQRLYVLPGRDGIRVVEGSQIPAVGRDFRDRVDAGFQQLPERLRVVRPTGEATADADNGDGFVMHSRQSHTWWRRTEIAVPCPSAMLRCLHAIDIRAWPANFRPYGLGSIGSAAQ